MLNNVGRIAAKAALRLLLVTLPVTLSAQTKLPEVIKVTEAVAAGGKVMPGSEIQKLFTGNTVYYVFLTQLFGMPRGSLNPAFHRDARIRVQLWKGKPVERLWWVEGDALCSESADQASNACAVLVELNGTTFSCSKELNLCRTIIRIVPGNPEGWLP